MIHRTRSIPQNRWRQCRSVRDSTPFLTETPRLETMHRWEAATPHSRWKRASLPTDWCHSKQQRRCLLWTELAGCCLRPRSGKFDRTFWRVLKEAHHFRDFLCSTRSARSPNHSHGTLWEAPLQRKELGQHSFLEDCTNKSNKTKEYPLIHL
jgi:hypothetical protein